MELSYKVPEKLVPYLEFIPEEQLCEMISIALEKAIHKRSLDGKEDTQHQMQDYTYLLEEITKRFQTATITVPTATARDVGFIDTPTYNFEVIAESSSDSFDEDLDDEFMRDITK